MKLYIPVFLAVLLSGCSASNYQDELAVEIITEKLSKNGPSMFCDQPEYVACYKISQKRCMLEVSTGSDICDKKAKNKFANVSLSNLESYSEYYSFCLVMKHAMKYPSELEEIGACLEGVEFDDDKGLRSLFK
ncbi:hypothetical protein A3K86_03595 [Photobacterium jeanii]|uniref:Lipoprotein n=1 Tax=Photobacterium jeanii TaxID=858640 RepID=A0A178KLK9_9GAMM|nr:hypothetical protein [Photobacterium jeanii]OAN18016.1 hypothetical protein A3K86_03595 [Photobacterium jeanii]PST92315.1 hypothetical protein C9I91_03845 [Photobacterium jeanii]